MNIPMPQMGYWMKIKHNKFVEKPDLPTNFEGDDKIAISIRMEGELSVNSTQAKIKHLAKEIISKESELLTHRTKLTNPHPLVAVAKDDLVNKKGYRGDGGTLVTSRNCIRIKVTPENIHKALLFMDAFIKLVYNRGHSILVSSDATYVIISNEKIEISIRETLKRVPIENAKYSWNSHEYKASGILTFNAKINYSETQWKNDKQPLEAQIASIIAKLEIKGHELHLESIERKKAQEEWERERKIKEAIEMQRQKELTDYKKLLADAQEWNQIEILRRYLASIELRAKESNHLTTELAEWLSWAKQKAKQFDPIEKLLIKE